MSIVAYPMHQDYQRRTPTLEQLQWAKTALEVFILLLAIPWILHELATNPGRLTRRMAGPPMEACAMTSVATVASPSAAATYNPGWYAVVTASGTSGLVKHNGNGPIKVGNKGTVIGATYVAPATQSIGQFMDTGTAISKIVTDLTNLGSPLSQVQLQTGLIGQSDIAAAKAGGAGKTLTQLLFSPKDTASASAGKQSVSTASSGDATSAGISLPSASGITGWIASVAGTWALTAGMVLTGLLLVVIGLTRQGVRTPPVAVR